MDQLQDTDPTDMLFFDTSFAIIPETLGLLLVFAPRADMNMDV